MTVIIYFSNQNYKFIKLPQTLQALVAHITSLFKNELPQSWTLQYLDSEGDHIIVSHECEYKELLELESSTTNLILKLYVVPNNSSLTILEEEEEFVKVNLTLEQLEIGSQKQGEQTAIADNQGHNDLSKQNMEVQPQVIPQPKNEGIRTEESVQFCQAMQLIKACVKGKHPETIKDQLEKELNSLKENLTEDEKQRLEEKKQRIEERMQNGHGHWNGDRHWYGRRHHHEHHEHPHFHPHHHHHPPMGFLGFPGHRGFHEFPSFPGRPGSNELPGFSGRRGFPEFPRFPGFQMFGGFRSHSPNSTENYHVPFDLFKFMKTLKKFVKSQRKGKIEKTEHCKEKLFKMIPGEGREILEAVLDSLPENLDKETLKTRLSQGVKQFVEICFPEGKDRILEKLENAKEKRKHKHEHKRHHHHHHGHHGRQGHHGHHRQNSLKRWSEPHQQTSEETKENDINEPFCEERKEKCKKKKGMPEHMWHKEKDDLLEKYSRGVMRKAGVLKMVFEDEEMSKLCEYVSSKPEELNLEQLIRNYRE